MRTLLLALAVVALPAAADYPVKPIRLVVPFPPGGTLDILARGIAPELTAQLGQPLVIENRPGANGAIGHELVAKAPADGYTLLIGGGSGSAVNSLLRSGSFDAVQLAPIGTLATFPSVLIANAGTPARSVRELIALAKAQPGKLSYGSPGTGNINNLVGEMFKLQAGVDIVHVPYKGAALVITDVVGGHIPIGFVLLPGAISQLRSGKLKALAVTTEQRVAAVPDLPTMVEAGVPGLVLFDWSGLFAPAGTPKDALARLSQELRKAVGSPQMRSRSVEQGFEPKASSPEEMAALMKSDAEKWARIVKQTGIRLE